MTTWKPSFTWKPAIGVLVLGGVALLAGMTVLLGWVDWLALGRWARPRAVPLVLLAAAGVCAVIGAWLLRSSRAPQRRAPGMSWWVVVAAAVVVIVVGWAATSWLLGEAAAAKDTGAARVDAIKTGLGIGAGTTGIFALLLAVRRQWHNEIDATEKNVTEQFTKASDQLGSVEAPVRLAGLYALERLAHNNPDQRQSIVNVICAYLRMPYTPSDSHAADGSVLEEQDLEHQKHTQEREVRLAAQRILAAHVNPLNHRKFWDDVDLDLTNANLIDFNLEDCRVRATRFNGATFTGVARFNNTTFTGDTRFVGVTFKDVAWFVGATFARIALFERAIFTESAWFADARGRDIPPTGPTFTRKGKVSDVATFRGDAWFGEVTFAKSAHFGSVAFAGETRFIGATFSGSAWFASASFTRANFADANFVGPAWFQHARFIGDTEFGDVNFADSVRFKDAIFSRAASFEGAIFTGTAVFDAAVTFAGDANFSDVIFVGRASFEGASFRSALIFRKVTFAGSAWFGGVNCLGDASFDEVIFIGDPRMSRELSSKASFTDSVVVLYKSDKVGMVL
ncbi:pentapeptide repeat-containing protein [Amycolatopsis sp. NPDC051045]|uniref:pentapeptide repeat-containing protein n=1 Tax=Amycolatopsis sp. NPDC051045 TaxID=3156922 RepID=UPI00341F2381